MNLISKFEISIYNVKKKQDRRNFLSVTFKLAEPDKQLKASYWMSGKGEGRGIKCVASHSSVSRANWQAGKSCQFFVRPPAVISPAAASGSFTEAPPPSSSEQQIDDD